MDVLRRKGMSEAPAQAPGFPHRALNIALGFVMLSLAALVVVPMLMERRVEGSRVEVAAAGEPARRLIRDVQAAQARQMSALRGFVITELDAFLESYETAREEEEEARSRLEPLARRLGPEVYDAYLQLVTLTQRWHASVDEAGIVRGGSVPAEYIQRVPLEEAQYREALEGAIGLEQAVVEVLDQREEGIRAAEERQRAVALVLSLLGLAALVVVGWFAHRLRVLAVRLERRAEAETAFRQSAEALSSALEVDEAMSRLARSSLEALGAEGAFVERLQPESNEALIMAAAGTGTPRLGTRIPYPDSLTQLLVERNEPVLATEVAVVGPLVSPYLGRACDRCWVLASLLLSEESEALGMLVLLRSAERSPFHEEDKSRARVLADLASLALRRGIAMEESERRREEVEHLMSSKAELMRGLSHDLKNPLGTVGNYAELLEIKGEINDQQRELIGGMQRSLSLASRIIDDVLELSRAEAGQLPIERKPVQLMTVIEQVVEDNRAAADKAHLALRAEQIDPLPEIETDAVRVHQVLENLISNAVKYTPEGGEISVRVALRDEGAPRPGRWIAVDVTDTGQGIPPEDRTRIFEEFYRREPGGGEPGTGLGLAIAQRIARLLGGEITLRSAIGSGSTFTLWVPVSGLELRSRAA